MIARERGFGRLQKTEQKVNNSSSSFVERQRMIRNAELVRRSIGDDFGKFNRSVEIGSVSGVLIEVEKGVCITYKLIFII